MESETSIWLIESPVVMVEGEQIAYSIDWQGAVRVGSPQAAAYKNGVDITEQTMDAGDEHILNGSVLTLKKLRDRSGDGGGGLCADDRSSCGRQPGTPQAAHPHCQGECGKLKW